MQIWVHFIKEEPSQCESSRLKVASLKVASQLISSAQVVVF